MRHLVLVTAATALVTAACGSSASTASMGQASPAPDRTVTITANDQLHFDPAVLSVRQGETVTFLVTNVGSVAHEFLIGDAAMQAQHESEMANGGMSMGMTDAVDLPAGKSVTFVRTFGDPGVLLYGCHIPGHYAAGMKGTITVTG